MKKTICVATLIAMLCSFALTPVRSAEATYAYTEKNVSILTPSAFEVMFEAESIDAVVYNYEMDEKAGNDNKPLVRVEMEISIADDIYTIFAQGLVDSYVLPSGDCLYEGSLDGALAAGENSYRAVAGFTKMESAEIPFLTVSIQGADGSVIGFYFGDNPINVATHQLLGNPTNAVSSVDVNQNANSASSVPLPPSVSTMGIGDQIVPTFPTDGGTLDLGENNEWEYEGNSIMSLSNEDFTGTALSSRVYFYPEMNQLAISTRSYCDNVTDYFNEIQGYVVQYTGISEFSVTLEMDMANMSGTNGAYILGLLNYDFSTSDYGKVGRALKPLFEELMSEWEYGSSVISTLLDSLVGTVETTIAETSYADIAAVDVSFGLLEYANFDDANVGVPLAFALTRASSSYVGASPMTATTTMKYRTYIYDQSSGLYLYFYTNANDAIIDLELDLG